MKKLLFLFLLAIPIFAQPQAHIYVTTAPSGSCPTRATPQIRISTGAEYTCANGTWVATGTIVTTGTVTSVGLTKTDDTNVTATITGGPITANGNINVALGWTGTLAKARIINTAVFNDQANTFSGGGLQDFNAMRLKPPIKIVATLPVAGAGNTNEIYIVTDGMTTGDCTMGGGTDRVWCISDGSAWVALAGSGASIPVTGSTLKGDGAGGATPVTGTATDCVLVDGTSGPCGTGTPGGSATEVQFNATTFGGDSNFTWDNTNKQLNLGGVASAALGTVAGSQTINGSLAVMKDNTDTAGKAALYLSNAVNQPYFGWGQTANSWNLADSAQTWARFRTDIVNSMEGLVVLPAQGGLCLPTANDASNVPTLCLAKNATSVFEINNGTLNTYADLKVKNLSATDSVATGTSPPAVTGSAITGNETTVPTVCAAASVDCLYFDSTQHGPLLSRNNGSYLPIPQGPTSTTVNNVACWDSTNGGLLKDCGAFASGSVFDASTGTASTFSATPTFSLANVTAKSPIIFKPGAMTANVTAVTFTDKSAGARFIIVWTQDGTGGRTVAYGASATGALCQPNPTIGKITYQAFVVDTDGSTVVGTGCQDDTAEISRGAEMAAPGTPAASTYVMYADSTSHVPSAKTNNSATVYSMTKTGVDINNATGVVEKLNQVAALQVLRRSIMFSVGDPTNSSALTTSNTAYFTSPVACTISGYVLMSDTADTTFRVKFWRVNGGTAIPTSGDSISTSGLGISTGTRVTSTTLTDFTSTAIAIDDTIAMNISIANTAKWVQGQLQCDQ